MTTEISGGTTGATRADALVRRLADSPSLRQRRFELLPVNGPGAPSSRPQGRRPGPSTSLNGLADLISSIGTCGLLSPALVEERVLEQGVPLRLIVAGERRVMSIRRGAVAAPDNPHFQVIPAIVCPGPLSEEERRSWQLIENLAREDLQPGELGAALLFERCAVLSTELDRAGAPVPAYVLDEPDPVQRYKDLEKIRTRFPAVGASWQVVLRRLGLQLSPRKARAVAAAVSALPREMSEEMDEHKVALYTRLQLLKVGTGRGDVAAELWQAVKQRGRPDLLSAAVRAHRTGIADPQAAVAAAEAARTASNTARGDALRQAATIDGPVTAPPAGISVPPRPPTAAGVPAQVEPAAAAAPAMRPVEQQDEASAMPATVVTETLARLRDVVDHLAAGGQVHRFDAGSLRLLATQLLHYLTDAASPAQPTTPKEPVAA